MDNNDQTKVILAEAIDRMTEEAVEYLQREAYMEKQLQKITKDDVWGIFDAEKWERISWGMVVARGVPDGPYDGPTPAGIPDVPHVCPIWGDKLPYKSVTIICTLEASETVRRWVGYVQGANSISRSAHLKFGRVAFRSDYQCW